MNTRIKLVSAQANEEISAVFRRMSESYARLFVVFENDSFMGVVSIGDIQRAIIKNIALDKPICEIMRKNFTFAHDYDEVCEVKRYMVEHRVELMPVVDSLGNLVDVLFWDDVVNKKKQYCNKHFNLPIVIMAGGKGSRLLPLTNVLPKPLIPIDKKTIIEDIMDRFVSCGSNRFFLSVNYKAELIRTYLQLLNNQDYIIDYFQETKPLGTAGSLKLLEKKIDGTFFISNCDILIDEDYSEILRFHRENKNELTLVVAVKNFSIPYGVIETGENGLLKTIKEKPNLNYKINTGMYVMESSLLKEIPDGEFYHITHLIDKVINRGGRIGCFPIYDSAWTDMGDWNQYRKMINI